MSLKNNLETITEVTMVLEGLTKEGITVDIPEAVVALIEDLLEDVGVSFNFFKNHLID
jgi:hypothetical protein